MLENVFSTAAGAQFSQTRWDVVPWVFVQEGLGLRGSRLSVGTGASSPTPATPPHEPLEK